MLKYKCCFPQTLVHHLRHLGRHLPGSANRWKTLIICLVFPPCPSSFKYNRTDLHESASGPSKSQCITSKAKRKKFTLPSPESLPEVSVAPQGFRLPEDLQLPGYQSKDISESYKKTKKNKKNRWVVIYRLALPSNINGICSHRGFTALKDQNTEDSNIQHLRWFS